MLASSRYSRRTRQDRLGISVVPEQALDAESRSPYLHWLFGESSEIDINSRLVEDDSPDAVEDGTGYSKTDAMVMREVAAWLELRTYDEFWVSRRKHARKVLPTTSQLLARLKDSDDLPTHSRDSGFGFDALIQAIALQLLASCYTFLPASSANHLPLFQQKTGTKLVTALRAHALYRLSPAAGHHARASSETSAWPGLYEGPSSEDVLAETVSQRRRSAKGGNGYIPHSTANEWTDGPNDPGQPRRRTSSSSSFEVGICTRLTCQPSTPKNPRRKHNGLFLRSLFRKRRKEHSSSASSPARNQPFRNFATQAVQHIPSSIRLRHTQSNPRMREETNSNHPASESSSGLARRTSSNPSLKSEYRYTFDIPEIRRISATPNASNKAQNSSVSMRGCGQSDMMTVHEFMDETQVARRPSMNAIDKLPQIPSWTGGPSPFSDPDTAVEDANEQTADDGYFNMSNSALLQDDQKGGEQDADDAQPKFLSPNYNDRHTENTHHLDFDEDGQTAKDRENNREYGTETGHDTQELASQDWKEDDPGNKTSANVYPTPDNRIHDRLARDKSGMYDDDNGPDPVSDPRLMKAMALHGDSDDSSSGDDIVRDRRRKSIKNEAGGFDSELARKLRPLVEDVKDKECSAELEGAEVR